MSAAPRIGILRMPIGNLQSAWNAFCENGFEPQWADEEADFDALTHLVMPGVGNFRAVMQQLEARGMPARVTDFAASGRPLLGICVGLQLLAQAGTEGGETPGLGLLAGRVERLPAGEGLRLPHVGWSTVSLRRPHPLFEGILNERDFYFVHAYALRPARDEDRIGETTYGAPFASVAGRGNVVGVQFHPEKSQVNGLRLLENFGRWDGRC